MSEETRSEDMRYELGRDYAAQGKPLHEGASEEFSRGFSSYKGFGSNVMPKNFGRTGKPAPDWTCVCGHVNTSRPRKKVARREVCWQCGVDREVAEATDEMWIAKVNLALESGEA